MNNLEIFNSEEFGEIRTVQLNNDTYFVGKDVAEALGYSNTRDALAKHVEAEDKADVAIYDGSQNRTMTTINESGLYALIFGSKLESAKRFKHWVTSEVLPSIRKHGVYAVDELINNPDIAIMAFTALKEEREKNKRLEHEKRVLEIETIEMSKTITEMEQKVNYVDVILKSKSTVCTTQIAQDYGMSAIAFNKLLNNLGIQHKVGNQWILYRQYIGQGYVQSETVNIERSNGFPDTVMNTKWTQKGRLFLYEELKKHGILPLIERN